VPFQKLQMLSPGLWLLLPAGEVKEVVEECHHNLRAREAPHSPSQQLLQQQIPLPSPPQALQELLG
jgi:hypothetical protein